MNGKLGYGLSAVALVGGALFSAGGAAQGLGRLFTTPEERQMLEALRHAPPPESRPQAVEEAPSLPEPTAVPAVTVNGVVYRSRGNHTVWVNGVSSFDGALGSQEIDVATRGLRPPGVSIRHPKGQPGVLLKPGQTIDTAGGRVTDLYQRGPDGHVTASPQ